MRYVLNISTRKLHDTQCSDGRCKLDSIKDTNRKEFETLDEANTYLPVGNKTIDYCGICMKKKGRKK